TSGEAAPPNPQTDHDIVTDPVHPTASSHVHESASPKPIPTSPSAQVNQQGPSSDPHVESSSKEHDSNPVPRSTAAPPAGEEN
ncbi:hypothetical protein Tco_0521431, partial [Tanacetum coccineum]